MPFSWHWHDGDGQNTGSGEADRANSHQKLLQSFSGVLASTAEWLWATAWARPMGVPPDVLEHIVDGALADHSTWTNPRSLTRESLAALFLEADA